ncbi:TetR family transcriptional regulator [Gordonia caeni]|uniref:TetR/AcrR family transcriptional regulator n=1 Tax=Gordonia caeni TaxID=1007097 RepID=A0ABP7P0D9_9ACTN
MEVVPDATGDRRAAIAHSGIGIIARDGLRALTHRAVDREAGIPQGSTSHHARTRGALIGLIVDRLEQRTVDDAEQFAAVLTPSAPLEVDELADRLTVLVEALASRESDMRARYALLLEVGDDPALRAKLGTGSRVQAITRRIVSQALESAGLDNPSIAPDELIALTDSLVFYRTVLGGAGPIRGILAAYLRGLSAARTN